MNLADLLRVAGLNRDSFNSLVRRDHVPFMRRVDVTASQDRFGPEHALALAAFVRLRMLGLDPANAGNAVDHSFGDIRTIVGLAPGEPRSWHCGTTLHKNGFIETIGWPHLGATPDTAVGSTYVDLRSTWADVQQMMNCLLA